LKLLLNTSTYNGGIYIFDNNWNNAVDFINHWGFHGYELYPVGDYDYDLIPRGIIHGVHMRFFVIITPLWRNDKKRLMEIFGSWENVKKYYGGTDSQWLSDFYTEQFNLAERLGAKHVVFHPVNCELEYVYDWNFPWSLEDTLEVSAELMNSAVKNSNFTGHILFENLWWPKSFTLDETWEYDYLLSKMNYDKCGITLDTGHLMNRNPYLKNERDAVDYINGSIDRLGEIAKSIKNVHLTSSLSGDYIRKTRNTGIILNSELSLDDKLKESYMHVSKIDRHEAFTHGSIASIYDKIEPETTVFEFTYSDLDQWQQKICTQKRALQNYAWPDYNGKYEHFILK